MSGDGRTILVLGATGQQGGSVARALAVEGWRVRAMVRDSDAASARALMLAGIELLRGDFADRASVETAMSGAHGVFSVQPSSGQVGSGFTDADEIRCGVMVADLARDAGVAHLIYTSTNAAGAETRVGHIDSKSVVETHLRALPIDVTIVRPSTFMEILLTSDFGLASGTLTFFMAPDQAMQFIAVEDIGRIVAAIFADRKAFRGRTLEIAGDTLTGRGLAAEFSRAIGRPVDYRRFPDTILDENPMLRGLTRLVDDGRLAGHAEVDELRRIDPELLTLAAWLDGPGRTVLAAAL